MDSPERVVRRATVDDLEGMKQLWDLAHLQILDLEKRLTEFQLVVTSEGDLLGALGIRVEGKQALVHSEAFTEPEKADDLRALLWQRVQTLAKNHGLVRIWTLLGGGFWEGAGFLPAGEERLKQLPAGFGDAGAGWRVNPLREESVEVISLEKELEVFQAAQREGSERLMRQARIFRYIAYALLTVVFLVGGYFLFQVFVKNPQLLQPPR